jgi:hypothetical protein
MKPVRTEHSNLVYRGPTPEIMDLHCQRLERGRIRSVWYLSPDERAVIAAGGNIELDIFNEPIPPTQLSVTYEQGVGEDAPEILDRLAKLRDRGVDA